MKKLIMLLLITSQSILASDTQGSGSEPEQSSQTNELILFCANADSDDSGNKPEICYGIQEVIGTGG